MTGTKAQVDLRRIGVLVMAGTIALSVVYPIFHRQIIRFVELYFSMDHKITFEGVRELTSIYYFGMALLLGFGFGLLKMQDGSWRVKMHQVLLNEPLCRSARVQPSPSLTLILSPLIGLLLVVSMRLTPRFPSVYMFLYSKDRGALDLFVPTAMLISAILFGKVVWRLQKEHNLTTSRALLSRVYLLIAGLFFFYAGEETSWGQDFFGWQTPSVFSGNVENQTNLHNYFNAYFDYGYIALSLVLVIVLIAVWLEFSQRWLPYSRLFLPHPSLIGLGLLIAFVAIVWYKEQELLEELLAVFVLFYSIRIFSCFRSGSLTIKA